MNHYGYNILKKFFQIFRNIFNVRKAFKIKDLKELHKIKQFTKNLKRRKFHSTSTEDVEIKAISRSHKSTIQSMERIPHIFA